MHFTTMTAQLTSKIPGLISSALLACTMLFTCFALTGCATKIHADAISNPRPAEALSAFEHFELLPIKMSAPYSGQEANERALVKIQQNFDFRARPLIDSWNAKAGAAEGGRTLVIAPYIQDIKFISGGARVWAGAMAGSSAVVLKMRLYDKATGRTIAEPEFFQRAAAMGGAYSFGATDNNMLVRIAEIAANYLSANYAAAVGGPTGAEPKG